MFNATFSKISVISLW